MGSDMLIISSAFIREEVAFESRRLPRIILL